MTVPTIENTTMHATHRASGKLIGAIVRIDKRARKFVPTHIAAEWISTEGCGRGWRLAWLSIGGLAHLSNGETGKAHRSVEWTQVNFNDAPSWARDWCAEHGPFDDTEERR
jgi:hypothetical protein